MENIPRSGVEDLEQKQRRWGTDEPDRDEYHRHRWAMIPGTSHREENGATVWLMRCVRRCDRIRVVEVFIQRSADGRLAARKRDQIIENVTFEMLGTSDALSSCLPSKSDPSKRSEDHPPEYYKR